MQKIDNSDADQIRALAGLIRQFRQHDAHGNVQLPFVGSEQQTTASALTDVQIPLVLQRHHGLAPICLAARSNPLSDAESQETARGLRHAELEKRALQALDLRLVGSQTQLLVYKGAALAHAIYPSPALRPHVDADLWVLPKDLDQVKAHLRAMGFQAEINNHSKTVLPEQNFYRLDHGVRVTFDLHWQCSARPLLAKTQHFSEIYHQGSAFSDCQQIRAPNAIDALLLAIVHLFGHRHALRLIWLLDLHLLWQRMDNQSRERCLEKAKARQLLSLLIEGLGLARQYFFTDAITPHWITTADAQKPLEASAALIGSDRTRAHSQLGFDWRHANFSTRLAMAREYLWANPEYLLARYQKQHRAWIPFLQVRRWLGIAKSRWQRANR